VAKFNIVSSQPQPEVAAETEVVMATGARRLRFRDAALTITTQIHELDERSPTLEEGDGSVHLERSSKEDGVTGSVLTSTKTVPLSEAATDRLTGGGRRLLLEDILRARRARSQQVGIY